MYLNYMHSARIFKNYKNCISVTIQKFIHLSQVHFVRKPSAKKDCSSQRNIQESTVAGILPHQGETGSSNNNFYGIEGDEGVIFVDDSYKSEKSMSKALKLTEKPNPEFKILNFGAVRLDSENKPNYHVRYHDVKKIFELHTDTSVKHINDGDSSNKSNGFLIDKTISVDDLTDSVQVSNISKIVSTSKSKDRELYDKNIEINSGDVFQSSQSKNFVLKEYITALKQKSTNGNEISFEEYSLKIEKPTVSFIDEIFFPEQYCENSKFEARNSTENFNDKQYIKKIDHFTKSEENKTICDFTNNDIDLLTKSSKDIVLPKNNNNTPWLRDDLLNNADLKRHHTINDVSELEKKSVKVIKSVHKENSGKTVKQPGITLKNNLMPHYSISVFHEKLQIPENETSEKFVSQKNSKHENVREKSDSSLTFESSKNLSEKDKPVTAYDFVKKIQNTNKISDEVKQGISAKKEKKLDTKGFRILKHQVPTLKYFTRDEILHLLKENVLYQDDDVVVLNKPYNLIIHESNTTKGNACLSNYLDDFAKLLDPSNSSPKLLTIHRLDKETTGCLLLARHDTSAITLKSLFSERKVVKTYWIVTSNVPDHMEGVIDIPISEGKIDGKARMVLHPNLPDGTPYISHSKNGKRAVTQYSVIAVSGNAALVEVKPETGLKHQIRVHFGFGLGCPILGDHKYSHLDKLVPQKLPSDLLQKLQVRQSKVRHIPLHIHSKHILIPQYANERNLFVTAPLPKHMVENLRNLKFRKK